MKNQWRNVGVMYNSKTQTSGKSYFNIYITIGETNYKFKAFKANKEGQKQDYNVVEAVDSVNEHEPNY